MPRNLTITLRLLGVGAVALMIFYGFFALSRIIGLTLTMVIAGLFVGVMAFFGTHRPEVFLWYDPYYLSGVLSRDVAIKWIRVQGWLIVVAAIFWTAYWLFAYLLHGGSA